MYADPYKTLYGTVDREVYKERLLQRLKVDVQRLWKRLPRYRDVGGQAQTAPPVPTNFWTPRFCYLSIGVSKSTGTRSVLSVSTSGSRSIHRSSSVSTSTSNSGSTAQNATLSYSSFSVSTSTSTRAASTSRSYSWSKSTAQHGSTSTGNQSASTSTSTSVSILPGSSSVSSKTATHITCGDSVKVLACEVGGSSSASQSTSTSGRSGSGSTATVPAYLSQSCSTVGVGGADSTSQSASTSTSTSQSASTSAGAGSWSTIFLADFNEDDGPFGGGFPPDGWGVTNGLMAYSASRAAGNSAGINNAAAFTTGLPAPGWEDFVAAEAKIYNASSADSGLAFDGSGADGVWSNGYLVGWISSGATLAIRRYDSGTPTTVASTSLTHSDGMTLRVTVQEGSWQVFVNGTLYLEATDSTHTGSGTGMGIAAVGAVVFADDYRLQFASTTVGMISTSGSASASTSTSTANVTGVSTSTSRSCSTFIVAASTSKSISYAGGSTSTSTMVHGPDGSSSCVVIRQCSTSQSTYSTLVRSPPRSTANQSTSVGYTGGSASVSYRTATSISRSGSTSTVPASASVSYSRKKSVSQSYSGSTYTYASTSRTTKYSNSTTITYSTSTGTSNSTGAYLSTSTSKSCTELSRAYP